MAEPYRTVSDIERLVDKAAAVIFDNDGTLVDSMPVHLVAWQQALSEHGIEFPEKQFYEFAGMAAEDIIPILADEQNVQDVPVEQVIRVKGVILTEVLKQVEPISVSVDVLKYAKARGIPVAVASGGEREDVLASLRYSGIDVNQFSGVVTREDVSNGKPHPETFLKAAKLLGVDPSRCIGLEDGEKGLQALRSADMVAVDVRIVEGYPLPKCLQPKTTQASP